MISFSIYLNHGEVLEAIIERAYRHVRENHTWIKRIEQFTRAVLPLVSG